MTGSAVEISCNGATVIGNSIGVGTGGQTLPVGDAVRVVLAREPPIRALDLLIGGGRGHPQRRVVLQGLPQVSVQDGELLRLGQVQEGAAELERVALGAGYERVGVGV